jgi:hypothetical protein
MMVPGHPGEPLSRGRLRFINSLRGRWQVLDPALECAIVGFRDNDVYMAGVVIDKGLPQWRDVSAWDVFCLPLLWRQQDHRLAWSKPATLAL